MAGQRGSGYSDVCLDTEHDVSYQDLDQWEWMVRRASEAFKALLLPTCLGTFH